MEGLPGLQGERKCRLQERTLELLKLELQAVVGCLGRVLELTWGPLQELQLSRLCSYLLLPSTALPPPALHSESFSATLPSLPLISPLECWDYSCRLLCSAFCVGSGAQPQQASVFTHRTLPISLALLPLRSFIAELGEKPPAWQVHGRLFWRMSRNCWGWRVVRTG